jgi:hypothetical protein
MNIFFAVTCELDKNTTGLIKGNTLPHTCANDETLKTIFLVAFAIIGGLTFLFMVIAGARYTLSKGEPDQIQRAKNELKYSAMGLVIAALAAAVVSFVIDRLG